MVVVVLAVDPGDVRKKKKKKRHLCGWVVVTRRARTNSDVLSKLRVSNKEKKKKKKPTYACGWWTPTRAVVVVAVDVAKVKGKGKKEENTYCFG